VHMHHALPRIQPILDRHVQRARCVHPLQHARHALHADEQVSGFGGGQVAQTGDAAERRDEDVTRQDGLEVDEGEGVRRQVEDLGEKRSLDGGVCGEGWR
jgi:hypothetical protein